MVTLHMRVPPSLKVQLELYPSGTTKYGQQWQKIPSPRNTMAEVHKVDNSKQHATGKLDTVIDIR